ncbi:MAG: hypothetical protein AAB215_07785 [Planctomycetota bacterium]
MNFRTTRRFRDSLASLPKPVRQQARNAYRLFQQNPAHPDLRFKRVHTVLPVYSVRIGLGYRAVGVIQEGDIVWFWAGPHTEYEALLRRL